MLLPRRNFPIVLTAAIVLAALASATLLATRASSQPQAKSLVYLQPSTPGTAQGGHVNISGTAVLGAGLVANAPSGGYAGRFTGPVSITGGFLGIGTVNSTYNAEIVGSLRVRSTAGVAEYATSQNVNAISTSTTATEDYPAVLGIALNNPTNAGVWGWNITTDSQGMLGYGDCGVYGYQLVPTKWAGFFEGRGYFSNNLGIGNANPQAGLEVDVSNRRAIDAFTTGDICLAAYSPTHDSAISGTSADIRSGVYGYTSNPNAFGVFAGGNLGASGTKSFVIDHPLDPANKILRHYCSEGPEPLNTYRGVVTTDSGGLASVEMPDYYSEINIDPTYQLTIVGGEGFPQAKIEREIEENTFVIRTSEPNVKVCWRVEARRNDRYVQRYGAPVEISKGTDKGKYLQPELYGESPSKAIHEIPVSSPASRPPVRRALKMAK